MLLIFLILSFIESSSLLDEDRHLVKMFDTFPQMLENMAHLGHLFNTDRLSYFIHTSFFFFLNLSHSEFYFLLFFLNHF